jgi:stringent starvation protein B
MTAQDSTSTRPYLIRALYEWCTDNGFTPYVAVRVDSSVQVPREFVKDGEIVLNIGYDATSALQLGNDFIEFKARFGGQAREIIVPVGRVIAIYARENGQGMAFPAPADLLDDAVAPLADQVSADEGATGAADVSASSGTPERVVQLASSEALKDVDDANRPPPPPAGGGRPALKRIK